MKFSAQALLLCLLVVAGAVLLVLLRDPRRCVQQRSVQYLGSVRVDACLYGYAAAAGRLARAEELHRVLTNIGSRPLELTLPPDSLDQVYVYVMGTGGRQVSKFPVGIDAESGGPTIRDYRKVILAPGGKFVQHHRLRDLLREAPVAGMRYRIHSETKPYYRLLEEDPRENYLIKRIREEEQRGEPPPSIAFDEVGIE